MQPIFNMFKVRYLKLDELMNTYCSSINPSSTINLHINFEMILNKLAGANVEDYLKVKKEEKIYEMVSEIINLAAHYRMYFTKNKLYSRIFIYLGYPFRGKFLNNEISKDFRKDYSHRYTSDSRYFSLSSTMDEAIKIVKVMLEYIQGVHLITSGPLDSSLVPMMLDFERGHNDVNFILTTDRVDYQYVNQGYYIIRPKQMESYMVTKDNVIRIIKQEEKVTNELEVGANFLPFIIALLGDKYRNIGKLKGLGVASVIKILDKAITDDVIGKDITNFNIIERILKNEYKEIVRTNHTLLDLHSQYLSVNIRHKHDIETQVVDKFDNADLTEINNRHFTQYPIQLSEVAEANKLIKKPKKSIFKP